MEVIKSNVTLTPDELKLVQDMNNDFTQAKLALGDLELRKQELFGAIAQMKAEFAKNEQVLVEKYGADSVINIMTGDVTKKEENSNAN